MSYRFIVVLLLVISGFTKTYAQYTNPGGVPGVIFWIDGEENKVQKDSYNRVSTWYPRYGANAFTVDAVDKGANATSPTYVKGSAQMAFKGALQFSISSYLASKTGPVASEPSSKAVSMFAIYYNTRGVTKERRMYYMGFGGTNPNGAATRKPAVGFSPRYSGGRVYSGGEIDGKDKGLKQYTTALQTTQMGPNYDTNFYFEGDGETVKKSVSSSSFTFTKGATIGGASKSEGTGASFDGMVAEIIIYNGYLSESERHKVEAYLATKYGITLKDGDYSLSNNRMVWPSEGRFNGSGERNNYHNLVAGIVRDDNGVNNYVARSTGEGSMLSVSTPGTVFEEGTGIGAQVSLPTDKTALYWGVSKGGAPSKTLTGDMSCGADYIIKDRIWKFYKTSNDPMTVDMRIGGEFSPFQGAGYEVFMNMAASESDAMAGKYYAVIPAKYKGGTLNEHILTATFKYTNTYVTFSAKAKAGSCKPCQNAGIGYFTFPFWKAGEKTQSFTASNGIPLKFTVNGSIVKSKSPAMATKGVLKIQTKGSRAKVSEETVTTVIDLPNGAAKGRFKLYNIDKKGHRQDNIEVIGYCGNEKVMPTITYAENNPKNDNPKYRIFNIAGNKAIGNKAASFTNKLGNAYVEFFSGVTRIEIKHTVKYANNKAYGSQELGLGNFELQCEREPMPNPDGIEFVLQAKQEIYSCEELTYKFMVRNYACESRNAFLYNKLPEGLEWVPNSLRVSHSTVINANTIINNYGDSDVLDLQNIMLSGINEPIYIEVKAKLKPNGAIKTYENRATLKYNLIESGATVSTESCDYETTSACLPTKTKILKGEEVAKPTLQMTANSIKCYKDGTQINLKVEVKNNANLTLNNLELTFAYNDDFKFKSFTPGGTVTNDEGSTEVTGLTLNPMGTATYNLILEAGSLLELVEYYTGKKYTSVKDITEEDIAEILGFDASVYLTAETDDICTSVAFEDISASIETIPFCGGDLTCYYPPKEGTLIKKTTEFVLISTLDKSNAMQETFDKINAFLKVESKTKGFVLTRLTTTQINALSSPVMGMLVYDTTEHCLKMYNGTKWGRLQQSCPDN